MMKKKGGDENKEDENEGVLKKRRGGRGQYTSLIKQCFLFFSHLFINGSEDVQYEYLKKEIERRD